ncbi:fructosamine kinase family protein [Pseudoalteromonas rubra]|uniref:Fructosamine kinase family protein n=1 Tax=Pseudoalteromonas rubra TaxID=43658 RepID=A0A5S3WZ96_9GAMM|nr:fructosamine kinase family protein [Pseudoalteromonas rubra]TMP36083.1 fructosamine kinase family protein [Pseudoalteromonas rubra]
MWNLVNQYISEAIHEHFEFTRKTQLPCNAQARLFKIENDHHRYLVKVDHIQALERFECEAKNHDTLIRDSDFLIADTIAIGSSIEFCFLVLEWLETSGEIEDWFTCGTTLAKLHARHEQQMYGLEEDNYFFDLAQPNQWHKKWEVFFAEERIAWQLQLLAEKGIKLVDIDKFVEEVKPMLPHQVAPSLLHGHFWRGNIAFAQGKPCLFCPSCYYGDREVDLAASELFAPLPPAFYEGYDSVYPRLDGYEGRRRIYQLYPLLCHANMFAGDYLKQAASHIETLYK